MKQNEKKICYVISEQQKPYLERSCGEVEDKLFPFNLLLFRVQSHAIEEHKLLHELRQGHKTTPRPHRRGRLILLSSR